MGWEIHCIDTRGKDFLMIFSELSLKGAYTIQLEKIKDERGFFARSWDVEIFKNKGLDEKLVQCNVSFNGKKGTLRGIHYQSYPHSETKLVRCTKGKVFEVLVDLRENSETYLQWTSIELDDSNYKMIYAPKGFGLGFQTLEDNTELFYQMSRIYVPDFAKGIRWDDPKLKINWPMSPTIMSERDKKFENI